MKVLLTGASGFVGSHILDSLVKRGIPCAALVRSSSSRSFLSQHSSHVEFRQGSIDDPSIIYTRAPLTPPKNIVPAPAPATTELGRPIGVLIDGEAKFGFRAPSRKLELYSTTLRDFGWPELAIPEYIRSHVHPSQINREASEFIVLSTYRVPTLIHTRSANAKWLVEISHSNPTWLHTSDAQRLGVQRGDLVRVETEIGYFVDKVWITEGIRPGVIACSHHLGRWRLAEGDGTNRISSALVELKEETASGH